MSTTDGKDPRIELVYPHPDGDVVVVMTATFRGDVRKIMGEQGKGVEKKDAELGVAGQFFAVLREAAQRASDAAAAEDQAEGESDEIPGGEDIPVG